MLHVFGVRLSNCATALALGELEDYQVKIRSAQLSISPRMLACIAGVALLALFQGCASSGSLPPAPVKVERVVVEAYKISPLDTLNIVVWRNPDLSATVAVRPDGRITLPLVEDIQAAGRSPSDLSREVEKALSKYIRDPVVSIVVSGFQSAFSEQVRIVGEATRPQSIVYRPGMTLLDLMIQSGGMTEFADGNRAVLVRSSEGGKQYSVRLRDLLKRGDVSANVEVRPGDVVIIPQGWF
jgi:polysaccharide export outer membrane protein